MTYRRPGVSFSINSLVASGVTSLGLKPVPPSLNKITIEKGKRLEKRRRKKQYCDAFNLRIWQGKELWRTSPKVRMRSILSVSHHFCTTALILLTSSGTTAVETTLAPNFSDEEFTTDTALGPLQMSKPFWDYSTFRA